MFKLRNRPRRNRVNSSIRQLVSENVLTVNDLMVPLFVKAGKNIKEEILSMPGQYRFSIDTLLAEIQVLESMGIKGIALFPVIDEKLKNRQASEAFNEQGLYQEAIKEIRSRFPDLILMTDIALDPYSSDGHDGLVDPDSGAILNDQTLEVLAKMALCQAKAGATLLGPSDMMDGRVKYIRDTLDTNGFHSVGIISYTAKYASSFYGPFRDALSSAPKSGDKKSYQMNYANSKEALLEANFDMCEGADILLVKPGLPYLDIIFRLSQLCHLPIAAYQVSGEYSMIKAAAQNGWINEDEMIMETLTAFKRAGCQLILSYYGKRAAELLKQLQ